ncbi:restriction endonuclease subunit S [Prevotella histicola]|uniref:restriction endonuclease subunit S n=2 Tax=Prevotella histicola TaxID=470565 RepID=UPI001C5E4346|nr:restriction endonuclease subunit S [Prevotella histicola]MBW4748457.1 restriction endonuclease subunit S [Prevotella histicola]
MEEWKEYKLGEIINILDYKRIPLSSAERKTREGGFPYYGAQGIIDYIDDYIFDGTYLLIAEDGENLKSKKQDIAQLAHGKYWVNNHAHIVESNGICDIRYLCYILNNIDLSGYITGSAQPKLNQANLSAISIILPPLNLQEQIADFISMFDNKIALNQRINDNLEQQAQALFKSWFVNFEPFKNGQFVDSELGKIPKGWKVGYLSEIADIIMGQSPNGSTYNENGEGIIFYQGRAEFGTRFPSIRLFTTNPTRIAPANSILISVRAPVGDINITHKECCIGRGLASAVSRTNKSAFLLYTLFSLKSDLDRFNAEGTVFGSINRKALETLKILIPTNDIISKFEAIVASMDQQILILHIESENLKILRDTLLPKLMSGERSVIHKENNDD